MTLDAHSHESQARSKAIVWLLGLVLTACCTANIGCGFVPNAPFARTAPSIDSGDAVLYGRFELAQGDRFMAVYFRNVETLDMVYVHLVKDRPIRTIRVPAGTYRLLGGVLSGAKASWEFTGGRRVNIFEDPARVFTVLPGRAYYVGDYQGGSVIDKVESSGAGTKVSYGGDIQLRETGFAEITTAILARAPWLQTMSPQPAWDMGDSETEAAETAASPVPGSAGDESRAATVALEDPAPSAHRGGLGAGFSLGGADLLASLAVPGRRDATMPAGKGLVFTLGYEQTRWRPGARHGLGFGLEVGARGWGGTLDDGTSTSFGSGTLRLSGHYLRRISRHWFARFGLAINGYAGTVFSAGEQNRVAFKNQLGASADLGLYWELRPLAFDLSLRATAVSYTEEQAANPRTVAGHNVGLLMRFLWVSGPKP